MPVTPLSARAFAPFAAALLLGCGGPEVRADEAPGSPAAPAGASTATSDFHADLVAVGLDPSKIRCNPTQSWNPIMRAEVKATIDEVMASFDAAGAKLEPEAAKRLHEDVKSIILWRTIRTFLLGGEYHNAGVVPIKGVHREDGQPLLLFRTGVTPSPDAPGSCVRSLIEAGGVRHLVNLYGGEMPTADLDAAERRAVESAGGTYFQVRDADAAVSSWRESMRDSDGPETRREAMLGVARLLNEHVLWPESRPAKGNVQIHCGGGMHRTGMLVGIIERCLNGLSDEEVARNYRFHTAWRSPEEPGGAEEENLAFIRSFDCSLLRTAP